MLKVKDMNENEAGLVLVKGEPIIEPEKNILVLPKTSKPLTNEEFIAEEKLLLASETAIEKNYEGWRGYWRLFQVSKVIGMLALYLYLDQHELHLAQQMKQAEARLETARRLTWLAVFGEKFHKVNLWFFHQFLLLLRWWFVGTKTNKEVTQEKQAVWLKENLNQI